MPGSIDGLDGLRAWAIGLVLLRHAARAAEAHLPEVSIGGWSPWVIPLNGWAGVDLFFLLSGFLIGGHLVRRRDKASLPTLRRYLGARVLRIVPTYYVVLFLTAFGGFPLYRPSPEGLPWRVGYHLLFLQDYLPSNINVSFWSLGVEEKFYLLAPFLVLASGRLRGGVRVGAWIALLSLPTVARLATLAHLGEVESYEAFFRHFRSPFHVTFDGLVLGMLLAEAYHAPAVRAWLARWSTWWLVGGVALVGAHLATADMMASITAYDATIQPLLLSLGFGAILIAVAVRDRKTGLLASYPMLVGARLSYTLYLVHLPLLPLSELVATAWGGTGWGWVATFAAAYAVLCAVVSTAIHFGVEQPFLRLKDRL